MRLLPFLLSAAVTTGLVAAMNIQLPAGGARTPRLGYFLSPQKGFWQNAEPADKQFNVQLQSPRLKGKVEVYVDDRLVPHVYAEQENDVYFVQGYLHAKFRLWQMDLQTRAAGGRLSEVLGESSGGVNFLKVDKMFRRLGMVYAAEKAVKEIEADPVVKAECDQYTAGVNAYIESLPEDQYPLEFKLLDYRPEPWSNLKTALFMKYMSYDLAGHEDDFEMTNARSLFSRSQFEQLYPYGQDSLDPIIPGNIPVALTGLQVKPPPRADSVYFSFAHTGVKDTVIKPDRNNGSNNWAVHGSKTKSGRPILCNDPHLGLNLPSIWYEMQLSTPAYNAYGVSFPGAPSIIIGFNDSCAFGFTNAMRDVRDYYQVQFRDSSKKEYWYNGAWQPTQFRDEVIKIKGRPDDVEHIAMTVWGPVMYDEQFPDPLQTGHAYACRWKAHDASNEMRTFNLLDHAKNYADYLQAISTYQCPGQNMVFATKSGDIAIRQQGQFPAKWRRQGDFVMPGTDSSYAWQGNIPDAANTIMHDPERGFVSSANQYPYDTTYPYYLGGTYLNYRGIIINRRLAAMQQVTAEDMQRLQTDNYNVFAEMAKPMLLRYMDENALNTTERKYWDQFKSWNLRNDAGENGPSVFTALWDTLMVCVFRDELSRTSLPVRWPEESTLLEGMLKDSAYVFADDISTPARENNRDMIVQAFKKIVPRLQQAESSGLLVWGRFKDSGVRHLLKIPSLSQLHLLSGGGLHVINCYQQYHGPSWRMVVELTDDINAYGVYPGGQSGNPGSPYYDNFINQWLAGKYYRLHLWKKEQWARQPGLKGKMVFTAA